MSSGFFCLPFFCSGGQVSLVHLSFCLHLGSGDLPEFRGWSLGLKTGATLGILRHLLLRWHDQNLESQPEHGQQYDIQVPPVGKAQTQFYRVKCIFFSTDETSTLRTFWRRCISTPTCPTSRNRWTNPATRATANQRTTTKMPKTESCSTRGTASAVSGSVRTASIWPPATARETSASTNSSSWTSSARSRLTMLRCCAWSTAVYPPNLEARKKPREGKRCSYVHQRKLQRPPFRWTSVNKTISGAEISCPNSA